MTTILDIPNNTYPIPSNKTWGFLDSSKIQEFMTCPRKFFFRYVLGWTTDRPNNHLKFGEAWHLAMEHLLRSGYKADEVIIAYERFLACYREEFPPETDDLYAPKIPSEVGEALAEYILRYNADSFTVLHTEVAGTVPINAEGDALSFKIDAVLHSEQRGIYGMDHKTASRLDGTWQNMWSLSFQMGTYMHALYSWEQKENVWGYEINGAFFYKSKPTDFLRVPIRKTPDMMQVWLDNAIHYTTAIKQEFERLSSEKPDAPTMKAFPQNTESCSKYGGCPFMDFCRAWANPLPRACDVPLGYKQEWWDPTEKEATAREVVRL